MRTRSALHFLATTVFVVVLAGCAAGPPVDSYDGLSRTAETTLGSEAEQPPPEPVQLRLDLAWSGLDDPLHLASAGDGSDRVFIVEKAGRIWVAEPGRPDLEEYLDITDQVSTLVERGLLSIAFSPEFAEDRRLYVDYTDNGGTTIVSRMLERDGRADRASEEVLISIEQPYPNHNGGQLAFGPDGLLYVGLGDGGLAGDPHDNGQDPSTLLGSILRLDVSGDSGYAVPASNPFTGGGGAPEVWAWGLRNPWRFSFDRETGDLWIGDVGQGDLEEIDVLRAPLSAGENLGWRVYEGTRTYADRDPAPRGVTWPVHEYGRDLGVSVSGGFVYRGAALEGHEGTYVFGDYGSGTIWGLDAEDESGDPDVWTLFETDLAISSFGEAEDGELYVVDYAAGSVYALVAGE